MRGLVRETIVRPAELVLPLFVVPGSGVRTAVGSMPGVDQTSVDELLEVFEPVGEHLASVVQLAVPADDLEGDRAALHLELHGVSDRGVEALQPAGLRRQIEPARDEIEPRRRSRSGDRVGGPGPGVLGMMAPPPGPAAPAASSS